MRPIEPSAMRSPSSPATARSYGLVKSEAESLGISIAEFVRRAIRGALPPAGNAPWMKFAGFVETGNPRSSQSIDDVVYGQKD